MLPGRIFRHRILSDLENPTGFCQNLLDSLTQDSYRIFRDVGNSRTEKDPVGFPEIPTFHENLPESCVKDPMLSGESLLDHRKSNGNSDGIV